MNSPDKKVKPAMTDEDIAKLLTLWKVERELNKHMAGFGVDDLVTISDVTREIRKHPEMVEVLDRALDDIEKKGKK